MYEIKKSSSPTVYRERLSYGAMPFDRLEVGEFFLLPCDVDKDRGRVNVAVHLKGEEFGKKFSARKADGGFNIFRTK